MTDLAIVLIVLLALVLIWRGPKTLPKLGQALGRGVREAKEEATKVQGEIQARTSGEPIPPPTADAGTTVEPPPTLNAGTTVDAPPTDRPA
ncbi:MAG: twin-arginine translocase TatA/TatE family subunit [Chloroflexota bacterium]|nr:twin-arginine translocase TatA/TatE family subunit [Chloroflexota bacterium]